MKTIEGFINYVIFTTSDGFSILILKDYKSKKKIKIKCNFLNPLEGMSLRVKGEYSFNKKYGEIFEAVECTEITPNSIEGLKKYLSSGIIDNIGNTYSKLLVDEFGLKLIDILDQGDRETLKKVKGIGKKRINSLLESWEKEKDKRNIIIYLRSHNIGDALANYIYSIYGKDSINKIEENPYRIIYEFERVGFPTADAIAKTFGIDNNDSRRVVAAINYFLEIFCEENGFTYVNIEDFSNKLFDTYKISKEVFFESINKLSDNGIVIVKDDRVYLFKYFTAEKNIAYKLNLINNYNNLLYSNFDYTTLENTISIKYNDEQQEAIKTAITRNLSILTGGPGTGKTTILKGILQILENYNKMVSLAAPTGRAAKRITEITGYDASTIHKLLGYTQTGEYLHNENNLLDCEVLIIDESSMINTLLIDSLLKAVSPTTKVIFIGDVDQLPCIGAGDVLNDMISSEIIPTIRLKQIYRQSEESKIITNAHLINEGKFPDLINNKKSDFFFINSFNYEDIIFNKLLPIWIERLPKKYNCKPQDIQILVPKKIGQLGSININKYLQNAIVDKTKPFIIHGDNKFYVGDKVIQIKNNYSKSVFNGDIGYINDIYGEVVDVDFDGTIVSYDKKELSELQLAYALTIHKSQGSEYNINIMIIAMEHYIMLNRNLLYTGVTRSKNLCIIIGDEEAINIGIKNGTRNKRLTSLNEFISDYSE